MDFLFECNWPGVFFQFIGTFVCAPQPKKSETRVWGYRDPSPDRTAIVMRWMVLATTGVTGLVTVLEAGLIWCKMLGLGFRIDLICLLPDVVCVCVDVWMFSPAWETESNSFSLCAQRCRTMWTWKNRCEFLKDKLSSRASRAVGREEGARRECMDDYCGRWECTNAPPNNSRGFLKHVSEKPRIRNRIAGEVYQHQSNDRFQKVQSSSHLSMDPL